MKNDGSHLLNNIELFEHNEIAFQKLSNVLVNTQMATINHATGTGKSFVVLKYLYENKDKRILYLSPTYPIFTQLIKTHMKKINISINDFNVFDHMIYRMLLGMNMEDVAKNYDIIILDEYHRCGAKEWGKKVVLLLNIIKEKYPNNRVVGLTATNKRYLDNERDMNIELFDGVCASTLELADAILQGILPAPVYINTMLSCEENIARIRNLVEKKLYYREDKEKFLSVLDELDKFVENNTKVDDIFTPYIKSENGKYIIFNRTKNSISQNKKKVSEWLKQYNVTSYEIHSGKSHEKNDETLENFRRAKEGINLLFVVDILNEGIHVDDIDGIIMMRHTTSPIIYFQQLGRLLSYSGRNDELIVWDLVNNLKSHQVIRYLYQDVKEKAKQLIMEDSKNAERYETILNRFKIIDNTIEIMSKIEKIEQFLTEENVINMRLKSAIKILNNPSHYDQQEKIRAHIDLFALLNFINEEMFKQIEGLNLIKPIELNVSFDEFKANLCGFNCLHEKKETENENIVKEFEEYIRLNNKIPSILSSDNNESLLARKVVSNSEKFSGKLNRKIRDLVSSKMNLSVYDRVYYGKRIPENKYAEFFSELDKVFNNEMMLSKNVLKFLRNCQGTETFDPLYYLDKIQENAKPKRAVNKSNNTLEERIIEFIKMTDGDLPSYNSNNEDEVKLYLEFNSQSEGFKNKYKKIAESNKFGLYGLETDEEKKLAIEKYVEELLVFINENYRYPVYYLQEENKEYSKFRAFNNLLVQFGFKEELDQLVRMKKVEQLDIQKNLFIPELIMFIQNNYGDLPSGRVEDQEEKKLAKQYSKFKKLFTDADRLIISEEIKKIKDVIGTTILELYINFILKNRRYPLENSESAEEIELVRRYKRNEESFTPQERERIMKIYSQINKKEAFKNTYAEILHNRGK